MNEKAHNRSGYQLEKDVGALIERLEQIGFARDIRIQDHVKDRDGNTRKVDISFVLVTWAVEILVSVECKSKSRPISLDDVDQLKTFKYELPRRNIFWLVYEGSINDSVQNALKSHGISAYSKDELAVVIDHMVEKFAGSNIQSVRTITRSLSTLSPDFYGASAANLKEIELDIISDFSEAVALLRRCDHYFSQRYNR